MGEHITVSTEPGYCGVPGDECQVCGAKPGARCVQDPYVLHGRTTSDVARQVLAKLRTLYPEHEWNYTPTTGPVAYAERWVGKKGKNRIVVDGRAMLVPRRAGDLTCEMVFFLTVGEQPSVLLSLSKVRV